MKKVACFLVLFFLPLYCHAADGLREKADRAWAGREDPQQAMLAVQLYEQLATKDVKDRAARLRLAEAAYWACEQDDYFQKLDKDLKADIADKGVKACRELLAKNEDDPEANYWLMWDMAARTLNKGIFSGFALKDSIVCTIMVAKSDVNMGHGGVWRYWARVIFEIPGLLGRFFHFTDDDTAWLYQRSVAVNPNYLRNRFWLAESYERMEKTGLAKKEYQFCAGLQDDAVPEAAPENKLYKKWAEERLAKM
ncbi:MAG TPA: hypothetical protein VM658_14090 [bacterium]|nr:hypothetical protein [bacterium]